MGAAAGPGEYVLQQAAGLLFQPQATKLFGCPQPVRAMSITVTHKQ